VHQRMPLDRPLSVVLDALQFGQEFHDQGMFLHDLLVSGLVRHWHGMFSLPRVRGGGPLHPWRIQETVREMTMSAPRYL